MCFRKIENCQSVTYTTEGTKMKERKETEREYDLTSTRDKFFKTGRKARTYARERGLPEEGFSRFITGLYVPMPGSSQEQRYVNALQEDGLLVHKRKPKRAA
jgi:hypothetical protein